MQAPVMVLNQNTKRETGKAAQLGNIAAAKVNNLFQYSMSCVYHNGLSSIYKLPLPPSNIFVLYLYIIL